MELLSYILGFISAMILYLWGDVWALRRKDTDEMIEKMKRAVERAEELSKK